jgi:sigma-B regulation protein RsbU (phosphoserine phosphatase)
VSGDFYDILPLDDGRIAFCLGDVSGKGMNAALLMAKTASLYRCLARSIDRPGRLLGTLNDEIAETATRGMFVTMTAGTLDPKSGLLCLASAGHEPAILHAADGRFDSIPAEAPPLGIAPGIVEGGAFPESDLRLAGGSLYVFSDGLTEATEPSGEAIGAEGLMRLVERFAAKPLRERVAAIAEEVMRLDTHDDMTLLAVSGGSATP